MILLDIQPVVGSLAWPLTILLLFFVLRRELKSIFGSLTRRIADPKTDISISKAGLEIKGRVEAALGRIESLENDQSQARGLLLAGFAQKDPLPERSPNDVVGPELRKLADRYLSVKTPQWSERVRQKDEIASDMAVMVIAQRIPRDALANQTHEGLLMALISAIHSKPEEGDLARLSTAAAKVSKLHIKYRIAMALGRLFNLNLAGKGEVPEALTILDRLKVGADEPLRHRINQTRAIIDLAVRKATEAG